MSPLAVVAVIFGGLLTFASVFWLIGFARGRRTRGWVRTRGMVVSRHGRLDGWAEYYPTFQWYDTLGRRHQGTSMLGASLGPRPGTPVDVLFDPRCPERGQMDTFAQSGRVFMVVAYIIAGLAVVGCLFAAWIVHTVASYA